MKFFIQVTATFLDNATKFPAKVSMVILLFGGRRSVRIHWKEVSHNFKACLSCILHSDMSDRQRRFKMYQEMTRLIHAGYLGIGNRKQLPQCLTDGIQDAFPNNQQEAYVSFRFKIIILFTYINSNQALPVSHWTLRYCYHRMAGVVSRRRREPKVGGRYVVIKRSLNVSWVIEETILRIRPCDICIRIRICVWGITIVIKSNDGYFGKVTENLPEEGGTVSSGGHFWLFL